MAGWEAKHTYPLAGDGTRMQPLQATIQDGKLQFTLDADTVWYEIMR